MLVVQTVRIIYKILKNKILQIEQKKIKANEKKKEK